jgi:hypothetical protein
MPTAEVMYVLRKELWIFDECLVGCPELPSPFRFATLEEIELWQRGELKKPFVVRPKIIKWPDDVRRVRRVTAKDRDDLRSRLFAIGRFLELFGCFSERIVVTLPGLFEVVVEGKYTTTTMLKPMSLSAAYKLQFQNEVVSEGGGIRWQRVPDD